MVLKHRGFPIRLGDEIKEGNIVFLKNDKVNNDDKNSSKYNIFNIVVHPASYVQHLKSRKHIEKEKHFALIIPQGFFKDLFENKPEQRYNL